MPCEHSPHVTMDASISDRLDAIDAKLDALIFHGGASPDSQRYLTAKDVGRLTGLDPRTILNRSNLGQDDSLYIPSLRFGGKRKYFDRRVVERLFRVHV